MEDLLDVITVTSTMPIEEKAKETWLKTDGKAMAALFSSLLNDQAQLILTCNSAHEIWLKLLNIHENEVK